MAKRKRKTKSQPEEHTHLSIRLETHEVRIEASLNGNLKMSRPLMFDDEDPVYEFHTGIELLGPSTYPPERAEETYQVQLYGDARRGRLDLTLKDVQARDEYLAPAYRTYRGEQIPIYEGPPGLATLSRRRAEKIWDAWVPVAPRVITDVLILLGGSRDLYLAIHERRSGRQRWIQSLSLQTNDPAEE